MIDILDLSKQILVEVRKVLEANDVRVETSGEAVALATSALARCSFAIAKTGDINVQSVMAYEYGSAGNKSVQVEVFNGSWQVAP